MARNRIISQSEALFVGPSPATGFHYTLTTGSGDNGAFHGLPSGIPVNHGYYAPDGTTEINLKGGNTLSPSQTLSGFIGGAISGVGIRNDLTQIHRVQGISHDLTLNRTDVNQFGQLARLSAEILSTPTVTLNFSYLLANAANEAALGFNINGTSAALASILNNTEDEKNYFIKTVADGVDAIGGGVDDTNTDVIGIGNGFITSYTSEASVGSFPTVNVTVEGLNKEFFTGASGNFIPGINPADGTRVTNATNNFNNEVEFSMPEATENVSGITTGVANISALRPGDITLTLTKAGTSTAYDALGAKIEDANAKIQSYNITANLSRTPIEKLGSKFAFAREIDFPAPLTISIDALADDIRTGSLIDRVNCDDEYDIEINIKSPSSCGGTQQDVMKYILKQMTLDSQSYTSSIGANKSVTIDFSAQIQGPNQTGIGLFISGKGFDTEAA